MGMMRRSPGLTCKVGSSNPSGVMKHKSSIPSWSILCWYENLTLRNPLELKSAGGLWATLPALKRGQGLATGGTGATTLVVVVLICAEGSERASVSTLLTSRTNETAATETISSPTTATDLGWNFILPPLNLDLLLLYLDCFLDLNAAELTLPAICRPQYCRAHRDRRAQGA